MKKLLTAMACAAALCVGGMAQANVLTFNDPCVIDIDNNTAVATYTESGFTISGQAATFLPLDSALVGGFDSTPFSLKNLFGGAFSLLSLDFAFYGLGIEPGLLTVTGLGNGAPVEQVFDLSSPGSFSFGAEWAGLTEVTFSASSGFSLDNINAVPEPGSLALTALALTGLIVGARQRRA